MGEVGRCDQSTRNYRIFMRSKKWWWALFALISNIIMPNCWLLHGENKKSEDYTFDLLAFHRGCSYLFKKYMQPRYSAKRPRGRMLLANRRVSMDVRLERADHYQSHLSSQRKMRNSKGMQKRDCGLHDHCFEEWHGIN